ncbi:hypothetical protein ES705_16945 [subsurface metagenome]
MQQVGEPDVLRTLHGKIPGVNITPFETSSGFCWNIFGTFTHNKNVVLELADGVDEITVLGSNVAGQSSYFAGSVSSVLRPGQEYGLLKGSVDMRDQDGNLLIDPSNGQLIRDPNPAIIGNPNPDFIVGLTNTFSFKGLRLSAVFDWKEGGDLFSDTVLSILRRGVSKFNEDKEMMKKMKIKYFVSILLTLVLVLFNSCEDWLDINDDPNKPTEVPAEINVLLTNESLLIGPGDDFEFPYGASLAPMNRNPAYQQEYTPGAAYFYINPYFYEILIWQNTYGDKGTVVLTPQ